MWIMVVTELDMLHRPVICGEKSISTIYIILNKFIHRLSPGTNSPITRVKYELIATSVPLQGLEWYNVPL